MHYVSNKRLENLVLSALFLALAYVLPFLTGKSCFFRYSEYSFFKILKNICFLHIYLCQSLL